MKPIFFSLALSFLLPLSVLAEPAAYVAVKLSPAGSFKAETRDVKGSAVRSGNKFTAQNIVVDLKSLNSGITLRDEHTKNKYLEVSKYPSAILVSATGENGKGSGIIKIKDIQKPIAGTYKVKGKELEAEFDLKLSDFGISGIKYMGVGVSDVIKITVTVPVTEGAASSNAPSVAKPAVKPILKKK